jgi:hypothetical protein
MKYSIVFLLEEEREGFSQFVESIHSLFSSQSSPFEILIMANGTGGFLRDALDGFSACDGDMRLYEFSKQTSEAVCLKAALKESSGEIIVVCGSYQQITSDSFLQLLEPLEEGVDIVCPWRQKRVDPPFNRMQSWFFNALVQRVTGTQLHDLSCTVRVFRREVLEKTELYGGMYRFLPIFASREGFKSAEVKCEHYQERGKTGFYSCSEYFNRLIDIFVLYFNTRFTRKPLRFFSLVGMIFFITGLLISMIIFAQRLFYEFPIGNRSALIAAIFLMVFGVLAASIGLLGEIIVFTHGRRKKEYVVEKTL